MFFFTTFIRPQTFEDFLQFCIWDNYFAFLFKANIITSMDTIKYIVLWQLAFDLMLNHLSCWFYARCYYNNFLQVSGDLNTHWLSLLRYKLTDYPTEPVTSQYLI